MYIELNPVLLTLITLLVTLLAFAIVRRASVKGLLLFGVLLIVCAGTNPSRADHVTMVRQVAATRLREASVANAVGLMADFKNGTFEALAAYRNLGLASMVVIHGKVLSFGVLGQVWVMKLDPLARSTRL